MSREGACSPLSRCSTNGIDQTWEISSQSVYLEPKGYGTLTDQVLRDNLATSAVGDARMMPLEVDSHENNIQKF